MHVMRRFVTAILAVLSPAVALANGGQVIDLAPTSISVVLPPQTGWKEVHISFSLSKSTMDFNYDVFVSQDSTCLSGPSAIAGVSFPEQSGFVEAGQQFLYDYYLDFEANGTPAGQYAGTFCITTSNTIPTSNNAVPISLLVTDDALFVNGFEG